MDLGSARAPSPPPIASSPAALTDGSDSLSETTNEKAAKRHSSDLFLPADSAPAAVSPDYGRRFWRCHIADGAVVYHPAARRATQGEVGRRTIESDQLQKGTNSWRVGRCGAAVRLRARAAVSPPDRAPAVACWPVQHRVPVLADGRHSFQHRLPR
jgi:hypothetical protein